jgi:hypothetical protein
VKLLVILTLIPLVLLQTQTDVQDRSGLEVVKIDLKQKYIDPEEYSQIIRNQTLSAKAAPRTPGEDLLERKAELRSMSSMHSPDPVKVNLFQAQMRNATSKPISKFVWAYQVAADQRDAPDQQFLCNVSIVSGQTKGVEVIPRITPRVVDVSAAGAKPVLPKPSLKDIIINQIQFADGTTWQRPDWNGTILLTREGIQKLGSGKCTAL